MFISIWCAWKKSQKNAVSDTSFCQKTLQVADNANAKTHSSGRGSCISLTQTTLRRENSFSDTERSVDISSSASKTYKYIGNTKS